ncbi:MAG: FG-GAP-like repeat-containing protein [Puia sp.]|nr:FG-GAP-like repeat-containing protein [Puia sp.]
MKTSTLLTLLLSVLTWIFCSAANAQDPNAQDQKGLRESDWFNQAQSFIQKKEYDFKTIGDSRAPGASYACANRAQKTVYGILPAGYTTSPFRSSTTSAAWSSTLTLSGIDKGKNAFRTSDRPSVVLRDSYLLQHHGPFDIEYTNDAAGLRQDFIILGRPAGDKPLTLSLAMKNTNLAAVLSKDGTLQFQDRQGKALLRYDGLKVWDADHKMLDAHMELRDRNELAIVVNDRYARYPVTIDPLSHSAEWSGSAQGALPSLATQLAIDGAYGFSVAGLGDVNGDGYADVAIGAPGLADVITSTGTLTGVGAVFVYYGSAAGLVLTPSVELQPSTAVTGALFGFSIAAGDINADGKNDIIVGAPLDKVTLSTGGPSGTVGKVYVFAGGNLSSVTTSPLLTLQLGTSFLQSGVNLSINALFGYSVAVTEDMNNDGKKDILVGSPAYAGISASLFGPSLGVQSGAAFLFLSGSSNSYTVQSLTPPTTSLLGLGLLSSNISGLLFGISVDGTGDYNGDGKPDVVIGAPAGVNLSSLSALLNGQLLQGSALVYYGNGNGVDYTQPGATLAASSGGLLTNLTGTLSNLVNLFGFSVKGVRDANGTRTGNILVGAPLGGVLTNLLGGLQVKTGTVSLFQKKSASPSGIVAPDQQLSSPRNTNTILNLVQSSLLFGFSLDNTEDVNCDGIADIIVGEPASSGVQLVGANVAGGSAYVFFGNADGTYQTAPGWSLGATYDATLGVNVAALTGYSVAGAGKVKGAADVNKVLVGSPGRSLDFGSGLLNLGSTLSTLFGLVSGNNGVGKSNLFDLQICSGASSLPLEITNFTATLTPAKTVQIGWSVSIQSQTAFYVIERSKDGANWSNVSITPGNPRDYSDSTFSALDINPYSGISYYRLKQLNLDNEAFYTDVRVINNSDAQVPGIHISNPFTSFVTIQLNTASDNNMQIDLLDINGQLMLRQTTPVTAGMNTFQVNGLSHLARGVYVAHVYNGTDNYAVKLIKE